MGTTSPAALDPRSRPPRAGALTFPRWIDGTDANEPPLQRCALDPATILFRQSLRTHFEAPFVVLLVGAARALLIDTGTGDVDLRGAVDAALAGVRVDLLVAHSHAHSDHVGGDPQFEGRSRTSIAAHAPAAAAAALGLDASGAGAIDLGDRVVDVLAIPGHEASHVAFYDRATRILFTGDTLYPGRLYVRDWAAYRSSVGRLVEFVDDGRPVEHVLGAHIELSAEGLEYPPEATAHPNEHRLELADAVLRDLAATVVAMGDAPLRKPRRDYVVVPVR